MCVAYVKDKVLHRGTSLQIDPEHMDVLIIAPTDVPPQRRAMDRYVSPAFAYRCEGEKRLDVRRLTNWRL